MMDAQDAQLNAGSIDSPAAGEPQDAHWMAEALAEAAKGLGRTAPNPPVGCVLVQGGQVVGRGYHPQAGQPHAEVFALREAGAQARGATAYVTLEPCSHYGRTPPCALALIQAGVARVVVAARDPNPQVNGRGLRMLHEAGIALSVGVLEQQAKRQQAGFRSLIQRGRPHVIYKYAMTLDGKVAAEGESNGAVSGPAARARVMQWRNECDAIAVGAGTILADDPQLTTRGIVGGRDPRPVLFDLHGELPLTARALRPDTIIIGQPRAPYASIACAPTSSGQPEVSQLEQALQQLGRVYGISTLLLEGGPRLASALFAAGLVDEVRVFVAAKLLGAGLSPLQGPPQSMQAALTLQQLHVEQLGPDVLIQGLLREF